MRAAVAETVTRRLDDLKSIIPARMVFGGETPPPAMVLFFVCIVAGAK